MYELPQLSVLSRNNLRNDERILLMVFSGVEEYQGILNEACMVYLYKCIFLRCLKRLKDEIVYITQRDSVWLECNDTESVRGRK